VGGGLESKRPPQMTAWPERGREKSNQAQRRQRRSHSLGLLRRSSRGGEGLVDKPFGRGQAQPAGPGFTEGAPVIMLTLPP
jgi:hypothetical protein